jgi:putative hydrolase of HD superfamily
MSEVNNEFLSKRMLEFQKLLNQFLDIERMIYLPDAKQTNRRETDTEHSYHLAMLGWYLCSFFPHLNREKIIRYSLAHDLVEIYAGDVMAVGRTEQQEKAKSKKEAAALRKLESEWPDFGDMTSTIREYESQQDAESVFVKALDKILPMMHNIMSDGKTWKEYNLNRNTIVTLKDEKTKPSKEVQAIWNEFRKTILEHDDFFNEGKAA